MKYTTITIDCRMIKYSGIGTYIRNIIPGLIDSNFFKIICLSNNDIDEFAWSKKVEVIKLKARPFSLLEQIELAYRIPKCDIAWFPNWNMTLLPIRAKYIVATIHDVLYLTLRDSYPRFKFIFTNLFLRVLAKRVNKIITVSNYSKDEILKHINVEERKIRPIYLGIDEMFDKDFEQNDIYENYILFIGNVKPHKNIDGAIEAFLKSDNKGYKFYIVGKKEGFKTGYYNLHALMSHRSIVFVGEVSDSNLKNLYSNAKLFFFPSKYEGFGLPILEAMKFNIPIIASDIGAIREIANEAIYYFNPYDIEDMTHALNRFFSGTLKHNFKEYQKCLAKYNWTNTIKKHVDIFQDESFAIR